MNPVLEQLNENTRTTKNLSTLKSEAMRNPDLFTNLMKNNPRFRQFVEANRGKSPQDIAKAYGLSWDNVSNFLN